MRLSYSGTPTWMMMSILIDPASVSESVSLWKRPNMRRGFGFLTPVYNVSR